MRWRGSGNLAHQLDRGGHPGDRVSVPARSSIESGITPQAQVTLFWPTFRAASDEAGISRRYGGIHFKAGDQVGRVVGRLVGVQAWHKAQTYFGDEDH